MKVINEKKEAVIAKVKEYVASKLEGIEIGWVEKEGGLYVKVKRGRRVKIGEFEESEYAELNVCDFKKTGWGFVWTRNGGVDRKFSYSKKVIEGLESNKKFTEGMDFWVLGYARNIFKGEGEWRYD
jgi:hypothetical protein